MPQLTGRTRLHFSVAIVLGNYQEWLIHVQYIARVSYSDKNDLV